MSCVKHFDALWFCYCAHEPTHGVACAAILGEFAPLRALGLVSCLLRGDISSLGGYNVQDSCVLTCHVPKQPRCTVWYEC